MNATHQRKRCFTLSLEDDFMDRWVKTSSENSLFQRITAVFATYCLATRYERSQAALIAPVSPASGIEGRLSMDEWLRSIAD
jgi:hypothetical protein